VTDELTPEQEAAVRRLLSESRHDEPVPADVAARLDEVLEGLVADEGVDDLEIFESAGPAPVSDLAGVRRRRRNAGRLLLAAAAIVIGGVAVGQTLGDTSFEGDDSAGSADSATEGAPREGAGDSGDAEEEAASGDSAAAPSAGADAPSAPQPLLDEVQVPVQLTSANFAADVQRELRRTAAARRAAANADFDGLSYSAATFECADGAYGEGATLPAYYDAEEAVLVLRRPRAGIQRVDLLTCGTAEQLNSVDLPAP